MHDSLPEPLCLAEAIFTDDREIWSPRHTTLIRSTLPMTMDEFFKGMPESRSLFERAQTEIKALGRSEMRVSKSQIAFRRRRNFVVAWVPGRYLVKEQTAPLVLTFSFSEKVSSPRWHLEVYKAADLDGQVRGWIQAAWNAAG